MTFKKGDKVFVEFEVLDTCHSSEYMLVKDKSNQTRQFLKSEAQVLPKKVVIPKFVAEWYEHCIATQVNPLENFTDTILTMGRYEGTNLRYDYDTGVYKWIKETPGAIQIISNMHQFGYEIEREQLYIVEVPNPNSKGTNKFYLCKDSNTQKVYLCKGNFNPKKNKNLWLTEPEIKQDFEWAWQWAKPVEE